MISRIEKDAVSCIAYRRVIEAGKCNGPIRDSNSGLFQCSKPDISATDISVKQHSQRSSIVGILRELLYPMEFWRSGLHNTVHVYAFPLIVKQCI